ncbi:unnamed protein product [Rangifer tarandus platyrhynchus]|uniref:Uncharacterized protein n=1 Tax=Rangifer tarandus platyrhynchus TaxID=3082113 RepID=A0AC59Z0S0_RANTA
MRIGGSPALFLLAASSARPAAQAPTAQPQPAFCLQPKGKCACASPLATAVARQPPATEVSSPAHLGQPALDFTNSDSCHFPKAPGEEINEAHTGRDAQPTTLQRGPPWF